MPGTFRTPPLVALAVDPRSGALHAAWFDTVGVADGEADLDLFLSRSVDRGVTWSPPRRPFPGVGDQFFPWLEADDHGRLQLVYFSADGRGTDADPAALLDVHYAVSLDGGESWLESRLTSESFSTAGASWCSFGGDQFVGDFLGLTPIVGGVLAAYPAASAAGDLDIVGQRVRLEPACSPARGLCLGDGFQVTAGWRTQAGDAAAIGVGSRRRRESRCRAMRR